MRKKIFGILNYLNVFYQLKSPLGLRVLAYHTVPDKRRFEKQLIFLRENYSLINIHQLRAHLYENTTLPKNPVLVTFDDGDISVLENGLPVLKKMSIPAVLFVITGLIDTTKTFWCRWVEIDHEKKGKTYSEARERVNYLKEVSETERKHYLEGLDLVQSKQLSSQDLGELYENKIFVANHTHTHPMINKCTDEEIHEELELSRREFRKWGLDGYTTFAYPNGNWDSKSEKILMEEGVEMAFLFDHKVNNIPINPFRISRIRVDTDLEINEFKVKVSGLHSLIMDVKKKVKNISLKY